MFYEALKDVTEYGKKKWPKLEYSTNSSLEGLVLGGLAGGMCCTLASNEILVEIKYNFIDYLNLAQVVVHI